MGIEPEAERHLPMEDSTQHVVIAVGVVAGLLLLLGFGVQEWGGAADEVPPGTPWGTLITAICLCVEAAAMSATAPRGPDSQRWPFIVAYMLNSIGWLCGVLLYQQFFPIQGTLHSALIIVAAACIGVAGAWLVYVAMIAASAGGYLKDWPEKLRDETFLRGFFGVWTVLFLILLCGFIQLPGTVIAVFKEVVTCLVLVLVGVSAHQHGWVAAVVVTFLLAFIVERFNPSPFSTSRLFHTTALANTMLMLHMASVYGLVQAILHASNGVFESLESMEWPIDMTMPMGGKHENRTLQIFEGKPRRDEPERMCDWYKNCTF